MTYSALLRDQPSTAQKEPAETEDNSWLSRAREAYYFATNFVNSNYRRGWEDSIRAFNNMHSSDSKYSNPAFDKRSKLFRPRTRTIIRKNEAAAVAAYFSNMDVVSVKAVDESVPEEVASAEVMQELLQYRLTRSIPWYQIITGGIQDAQTVGVVCAHIYWEFSKQDGTTTTDKPVIDLIPVENLLIDPGADWMDPIGTTPYLIHLIPMYAMDVREKAESGEWNLEGEGALRNATKSYIDSTRVARHRNQEDPYSGGQRPISDYEIVWVQRHIHRRNGVDWEFYTLSDISLLSKPRPLSESVLHGIRPYVLGNVIIEAHKVYKASVAQLGKDLQIEANEVANQRIDNVKFVLNKKWFVKRGRDADVAGLVRNVPGGVVMLDDPINDVREVTWPDVTASAFEEQARIDNDFNELLGNFSPTSLVADRALAAPARNINLLNQSHGTLTEYLIRTFTETFVQPTLWHLVKLEQAYETNLTVIALAARKANVFQRFGVEQVTDELLERELTLTVNVGMGATDPQARLQKFLLAMNTYVGMLRQPTPGINMQEVGKEIFGHLGYSDGARFFTHENPQVEVLTQKFQQAMAMVRQLQAKLKERQTGHLVGMEKAKLSSQTKLQVENLREEGKDRRNVATHIHAIMGEAKKRGHDQAMEAIRRRNGQQR